MDWISFFYGTLAGALICSVVAASLWVGWIRRMVRKHMAEVDADCERIKSNIEETRRSIKRGARRSDHRFQL